MVDHHRRRRWLAAGIFLRFARAHEFTRAARCSASVNRRVRRKEDASAAQDVLTWSPNLPANSPTIAKLSQTPPVESFSELIVPQSERRIGPGLRERRDWSILQHVIDVQVDVLVVKAKRVFDLRALGNWRRITPHDVLDELVAETSRPALFVANAALFQEVRRSLQGAPPK